MKRNWNDIKWIFEPNGSLRDLYVQETSIEDWEKIIDLLNEKYQVKYWKSESDEYVFQIDKEYSIAYFLDETGEMEFRHIKIQLGSVQMNFYFFLVEQIEFDIDPKEINSIDDFEQIENFMIDVSRILGKQITLTEESSPKLPLMKVDYKMEINRILSKEELDMYWNKPNSTPELNYSELAFKEKLLESANQIYKPTLKSENMW